MRKKGGTMRKTFSRLCSIVLAVCMLVNTIPADAIAMEAEETTVATETLETGEEQSAEEIIEERTEYTKKFRLSNGLYMAAVYPEPVHFEEDGEWKEIDNTLRTSREGLESGYGNTAGVWDVHFPKKMEHGDQISITKDGYKLSFGLDGELNQSRPKKKIVKRQRLLLEAKENLTR